MDLKVSYAILLSSDLKIKSQQKVHYTFFICTWYYYKILFCNVFQWHGDAMHLTHTCSQMFLAQSQMLQLTTGHYSTHAEIIPVRFLHTNLIWTATLELSAGNLDWCLFEVIICRRNSVFSFVSRGLSRYSPQAVERETFSGSGPYSLAKLPREWK